MYRKGGGGKGVKGDMEKVKDRLEKTRRKKKERGEGDRERREEQVKRKRRRRNLMLWGIKGDSFEERSRLLRMLLERVLGR